MCFKRSFLFVSFFFLNVPSVAQLSLSGKTGLIYIPVAEETKDGELLVSYALNPTNYNIKNYGGFSENVFAVNLTVLPRLDVNINLLKPNGNIRFGDRGIGDRQIEFKYLAVKQQRYIPAIAVYVAAPLSTDLGIITNVLVATKDFKVSGKLNLQTNLGYASPWYVYRDVNVMETNGIFDAITIGDKRDNPFPHLAGPIAGLKLSHQKKYGIMAEWDSRRFNTGIYATLFNCWTIQAGLIGMNAFTVGTSYRAQLKKTKKKE